MFVFVPTWSTDPGVSLVLGLPESRLADDIYDYDNVQPFDSWAIRMLRRFRAIVEKDAVEDERKRVRRAVLVPGPRGSRATRHAA